MFSYFVWGLFMIVIYYLLWQAIVFYTGGLCHKTICTSNLRFFDDNHYRKLQ
jgi:hypothetical protein